MNEMYSHSCDVCGQLTTDFIELGITHTKRTDREFSMVGDGSLVVCIECAQADSEHGGAATARAILDSFDTVVRS